MLWPSTLNFELATLNSSPTSDLFLVRLRHADVVVYEPLERAVERRHVNDEVYPCYHQQARQIKQRRDAARRRLSRLPTPHATCAARQQYQRRQDEQRAVDETRGERREQYEVEPRDAALPLSRESGAHVVARVRGELLERGGERGPQLPRDEGFGRVRDRDDSLVEREKEETVFRRAQVFAEAPRALPRRAVHEARGGRAHRLARRGHVDACGAAREEALGQRLVTSEDYARAGLSTRRLNQAFEPVAARHRARVNARDPLARGALNREVAVAARQSALRLDEDYGEGRATLELSDEFARAVGRASVGDDDLSRSQCLGGERFEQSNDCLLLVERWDDDAHPAVRRGLAGPRAGVVARLRVRVLSRRRGPANHSALPERARLRSAA